MRTSSAVALFTGLATFAVAAGDITGTITLQGTPPAEIPIKEVKADPFCGKLVTDQPTTRFFVVGPNKELGDVVVMLKGISGKSTGASAPPAVLDQEKCAYTPQILALQTGQKLLVKNSDPLLHNVHLTPKEKANETANAGKLNLPQMEKAPDLVFTFPAAENFLRFQCDVHKWMFAWVTVVDHPYFAVTGPDGKFKISNVPSGKYTITALHRKAAPDGIDKEIEVKDGAATTVDFTVELK